MKDISSDPRYTEATRLFDMWEWGFGMPIDPHARTNLRHAVGWMACSSQLGEDFMTAVLKRYLVEKYHDAVRNEMQRIAIGASRNVTEGKA